MSLAQDNFAAASAAVTTRHLVAADDPSGRFARDALARDKRESLDLAVRARWATLAVVGAMLPVLNFQWEVLYYEALLLVFALIGWGQRRGGTVGRSRPELLLMFCDIALLTIVCVVPNPFGSSDWPTAMQYRLSCWPERLWPTPGARWWPWAFGPRACGRWASCTSGPDPIISRS